MSRRSTPGSDFGRLAIGDDADMPVTTRAAMNRQRMNLAASQRASSGRPAASSSGIPSGGGRRRAQVPSSRPEPADESTEDDEANEDNDEDGAKSSSEDEADVMTTVLQIMSAFDPQQLTPTELRETGRQRSPQTLQFATVIAQLVRSDADLQRLSAAVPIGGEFWSARILNSLQMRFDSIYHELQRKRVHRSQGRGVIETVTECRKLYDVIADVRRNHFGDMQRRYQQPFVTLMVDILTFLSDDTNQFANSTPVHYAGEGFQSETRLLSSCVAERGPALQMIGYLHQLGAPLLRGESQRLAVLYGHFYAHANIQASQTTRIAADTDRLHRILRVFAAVVTLAQSQP